MKLLQTLIGLALFVSVIGCKKDKTPDDNKNQFVTGVPPLIQGKTPFQLVHQKFGIKTITIEQNGRDWANIYTYDRNQQMIEYIGSLKEEDGSTYEEKNVYIWSNHLLLESKYYWRKNNAPEWILDNSKTYTYDNQERLTKSECKKDGKIIGLDELIYVNNTIVYTSTTNLPDYKDTSRYIYTTNQNNQIIKEQYSSFIDGEWKPSEDYTTYLWLNDNLAERKYGDISSNKYTYTYDDKNNINRLLSWPGKIGIISGNVDIAKNNIYSNPLYSHTFEYEYNTQQFPIKIRISKNETNDSEYIYKYTYHY